jgi:hypothetical protein
MASVIANINDGFRRHFMVDPHFVSCEIFFLTSIQREKKAELIVDGENHFCNQAGLNAFGDAGRVESLCFQH